MTDRTAQMLRESPLLLEAMASLMIARLNVTTLPFPKLVRGLTDGPWHGSPTVDFGRLRWAIATVARRMPTRAMCLEQALAMHWMLRRRRVTSRLRYGVRQAGHPSTGRRLEAHVWLTVDGAVVIGGERYADFVPVATFGAATHS